MRQSLAGSHHSSALGRVEPRRHSQIWEKTPPDERPKLLHPPTHWRGDMGAAIPPWSISTVGTRGEAAPGAERRLREKTGRAPMRINKPQIGSSKEELMLRRGCQVPRGEERGASSDFRSAPSCASHPSSKMEPALALLHLSTFGGKISEHPSGSLGSTAVPWPCFIPAPLGEKSPSIPRVSGEHSRVLDPPQPAHAKPGICTTPGCVQ